MRKFFVPFILSFALLSCSEVERPEYPQIFPDYVGVTVPEDIAPLKFRMQDGRRCRVRITREDDTLWYEVTAASGFKSERYKPFPVYVSHDAIDPYIAYRLIEPAYESWNEISLNYRDLRSYDEKLIASNKVNNQGCLNCHTFDSGNPDRFMFHARGAGGGTIFVDHDNVKLLNLATVGPRKQGTYTAWHPSGRWICFSSNSTHQSFTVSAVQPVEVYDTSSDIILYDTQTDSVYVAPQMSGNSVLETFPAWSPDGRTLYYCAADNVDNIAQNRGQVHYRLMSIGFDNGEFIGEPQTLFADDSSSVSFPRVNGDKLLFTRSAFGTFPIWHSEADLWLYDLNTGELQPAEELNSPETDSYHSWSSNGKWVVFSSRRLDGRYTRLFIAHYNGDGHFTKPFLLPQKNPDQNIYRTKSYNIPEFVKGPVTDRQDVYSSFFKK